MSETHSWNQGDSIQTESGTHLGIVKKTTEMNGQDVIIVGNVNTRILDTVAGLSPNDKKAGDIGIYATTVVECEPNSVIVENVSKKQLQSSYGFMVEDEINARLDTVEEGVINGDVSTVDQANELQEDLRKFRRVIRTAGQDGLIRNAEKFLKRIDKIDEGITKGMNRILKNRNSDSVSSRDSTSETEGSGEDACQTKDDEVKKRMVQFAKYINNEFNPAIENASPDERPKMARQALREAKELREMIREFDKAGELKDEEFWYDKIDSVEEQLREEERRAIRHAEKNNQSFMESLAEGVKTYQELKRNPTGKDNGRDKSDSEARRKTTREARENEQQTDNNDPYTGGKSQSSSISESVSRFWNTVTFKNAFSPKCPNCNRKSSAPVSGEEDVYQCDNCGNIFDTHPDSRREVDFE